MVGGAIPTRRLERLSADSLDAYELHEEAPPGTWERVAAWNAYLHQSYADRLIENEPGSAAPDTAAVASELYRLAASWLALAHACHDSPDTSIRIDLRQGLPRFGTPLRTGAQVEAMRATLDDARIRVASELVAFDGPPEAKERLAARLQRIDERIESVELLWVARRSDEVRGGLGDALADGLERARELGVLLARPALLDRLGS